MNILTQNKAVVGRGRGRLMLRVSKQYPGCGYVLQDGEPTVSLRVVGTDGKMYEVQLAQRDLDGINYERARMAAEFDNRKGEQA